MTWKQRINRATERGYFTEADDKASQSWCRCIVGEIFGVPLAIERLNSEYNCAIGGDGFDKPLRDYLKSKGLTTKQVNRVIELGGDLPTFVTTSFDGDPTGAEDVYNAIVAISKRVKGDAS